MDFGKARVEYDISPKAERIVKHAINDLGIDSGWIEGAEFLITGFQRKDSEIISHINLTKGVCQYSGFDTLDSKRYKVQTGIILYRSPTCFPPALEVTDRDLNVELRLFLTETTPEQAREYIERLRT